MDFGPNDALPLEGRELTNWAVLPGGNQIRLEFIAAGGRTHAIILPFDALSGLLMTLPRMLQAALDARFDDSSLRVVQFLSTWQLERAWGDDNLILKLGTKDGFEVAFAMNDEDAGTLGAALAATPQETSPETSPSLARRPH